MSIMPGGGRKRAEWSESQEDLVIPAYLQNHNDPSGLRAPSNKSIWSKLFSGCLVACTLAFIVVGLVAIAAIKASRSVEPKTAPIVERDSLASPARAAVSDSKTYSVRFIDEYKNKIPTGTELLVQGTVLDAMWDTDPVCVGVLMNRARVQHGDDPNEYCWYHILLTQKRPIDGEDMWPAAALVCDVSPSEFMRVTKLYKYSAEVRVHGFYAPSLDFTAVPLPHVGVPLLNQCTFMEPTDSIVRLASELPADPTR